MTTSLTKKVSLAALIMMASVFLSRVIGLLREIVIAKVGGATGEVDAYNFAFVISELLNHVVASGFLSVTFIPIFSSYLAKNREEEGWRVFSIIFSVFGALLSILIVQAWIFAPQLVALLAPGLKDPALLASATRMTRIIVPAQIFFFAGGLLMAVQFAKEQFKLPALAPLIYNLGIILGGIALSPWLGMEGFAWGVLAGAFMGNFVIQYFGAKRVGLQFSMVFDVFHPDLKKYILLTLPLMLGLTMTFSTEFLFRFFGSYLPEGGVSALNYGLRVTFILVGLFGQAAGTASFPFLSRLVAEGKMEEMNQLLNHTLRRYIALVIPFSALLMVLSHEVVLMLFQRGRFDAIATARTATVLLYLLPGAFAFAAQTVVVRGYYATQNTIFPTLIGTLAVAASLPLYWLGVAKMGIQGLSLAISLSAIFQVILLYALWNRSSNNLGSRQVYHAMLKMIVLSAVIGLLLFWFRTTVLAGIDTGTFMGSLLICVIISALFLVIFIAASYIFDVAEAREVFRRLVKRKEAVFRRIL